MRQQLQRSNPMVQTQIVNHIGLIVDESYSMKGQPTIPVFDAQLNRLKQRSIDMNQETRISIYLFNATVRCIAFDMDVMRFSSLEGHYHPEGNTALIDATLKAIADHEKIPTMYGDHAFLQYVITDGENNINHMAAPALRRKIESLAENWTTACLVPDASGKHEAKQFGFPGDSIAVWNPDASTGLELAGRGFADALDNYMTMRSTGVRGTKGLFTLDSSGLTKRTVVNTLNELSPRTYDILPVRYHIRRGELDKGIAIKEFVEGWNGIGSYVLGSAYYQPTKPVKIQDHKNILIQDIKNGKVYEGAHIRQLLGLPDQTVEVNPGQHRDWRVFVQSTSVNRKLFKETFLLIRK